MLVSMETGASGGGANKATYNATNATLTETDIDTYISGEIYVTTQIANGGIIGTVNPAPASDTVAVMPLKTNLADTRRVTLNTSGQLVNNGTNMAVGGTWLISLAYKS